MIFRQVMIFILANSLLCGEFKISIVEPQLLVSKFNEGLNVVNIIQGYKKN